MVPPLMLEQSVSQVLYTPAVMYNHMQLYIVLYIYSSWYSVVFIFIYMEVVIMCVHLTFTMTFQLYVVLYIYSLNSWYSVVFTFIWKWLLCVFTSHSLWPFCPLSSSQIVLIYLMLLKSISYISSCITISNSLL